MAPSEVAYDKWQLSGRTLKRKRIKSSDAKISFGDFSCWSDISATTKQSFDLALHERTRRLPTVMPRVQSLVMVMWNPWCAKWHWSVIFPPLVVIPLLHRSHRSPSPGMCVALSRHHLSRILSSSCGPHLGTIVWLVVRQEFFEDNGFFLFIHTCAMNHFRFHIKRFIHTRYKL